MLEEIQRLRERENMVILAHNYQRPEIQDIADFVGDSLDLSRFAMNVNAKFIVFCGVSFMAETACILNPEKTVLMPDLNSHCPMAMSCTREMILKAREKHPKAKIVAYINTTAEAKTAAQVVCTSANAVKIVESLDADEIIFVPDRNLASYVQRFTSKKIIPVPEKGFCATHQQLMAEDILIARKEHPKAEVIVHPECRPEVIDVADFVYGTSGMVKHAKKTKSREMIVGTESGLIHRLKRENPEKRFYEASEYMVCPNMKLHTLPKVLEVMKKKTNIVKVSKKIREMALKPLERMFEIT